MHDVSFLVCDGLKGLPDAVADVSPHTVVQACVVHLIRNIFRLVARQDRDAVNGASPRPAPHPPPTPRQPRWRTWPSNGAASTGR
ncbi:transposase [Actinosynnema sp. NPDC047251]|uniref:Mutator family transposase n=1 Tax=Saccharothrix espanaensis (strain ATCC 51144 / DSM 44229 / JCM 9112 / NBRC 15066 / NRRL 15764) TaxID=1179773 RepID=K0K843_SACES|nr:transposase [Saccharothrix espanaensis]CCH32843.1 hypothetical protein BN6_55830 [Saccharothrix espanaensis DSM 44229]